MALTRTRGPSGNRVYMWDTTPLQEFVTPHADLIEQLVPGLQGFTKGETIWNCWDWVCRNIKYKSEWSDVWLTPVDAILRGYDDCEEKAFTVCSLLRACGLSPDEVFVTLGNWFGIGHAWCAIFENGKYWVLEATLPAAPNVAMEQTHPYYAYILFNDIQTITLRTGFSLSRANVIRNIRAIEESYRAKVE